MRENFPPARMTALNCVTLALGQALICLTSILNLGLGLDHRDPRWSTGRGHQLFQMRLRKIVGTANRLNLKGLIY
jgi:hypothetical protein